MQRGTPTVTVRLGLWNGTIDENIFLKKFELTQPILSRSKFVEFEQYSLEFSLDLRLFRKWKPISSIRIFCQSLNRPVMMAFSIQSLVQKRCANRIVVMSTDAPFSIGNRSETISKRENLRRNENVCFTEFIWIRFRLIKNYLIEFNQLAMSAANGSACHDMMNRVMTKDNIGLVACLETKEDIYAHNFANGTMINV